MPSVCKSCGIEIPGSVPHDYCADCPPPTDPFGSLRQSIITILGGECTQCGSKTDLQIDHVNDNGAEERKKLSQNKILAKVADELILNKLHSNNYQVLCSTCNLRKRFSNYNQTQTKRNLP
jgi:hypothetical protein